ncbi:MAG: hypothetical protein A3B66_09585 [Alphaproteobacteria bacterium RIFCSPHIGHO2_02_FULL_46_13]|nr:MAG: hypothetical protein A3B66_09585 [Alphaproteobacteria bacterium RIFCSPHIGHO2_02_FULL_46_13]
MAASIALNTSSYIDETPAPSKGFGRFAGGLLKRVKQVGESLRHPSPETIAFVKSAAFVGLSIGAGIGAKAGALALFGVATGGTGIAAAVIGGAAVGLSKAAVKHLKERNQEGGSKFLSFSTLKTAGIGAAISTATLGYSELFEHFTGETVTQSLGKAFHKVAEIFSDKLSDVMPTGSLHAPTHDIPKPIGHISAPSAPVAQAIPDSVPKLEVKVPEAAALQASNEHVSHENMPKPKVSVPTPPPASVAEMAPVAPAPVAVPDLKATIQAQALEEKLRYDYATSFGDPAPESMTTAEMAERLYPEDPKAYMASASDMAQDNLESGRSQFSADYQAINEAPAPAPEIAPAAPQAVPNTNTGIPVSNASPQELAAQAIAKAKLAVTQEELTNAYTMEHLHESVKNLTGTDAPVDATAEDLAKQISPAHSDVIIKNLQAQAPQLKVENLAASCTAEIPKERSSVNVIKTLCYKFKEHMSGNDIAIVDNANEANAKNGLRLLYRKAVSAVSGLVQAQETNGFIAENISGPNGVVQEMTEARLGL